MGQEQPMNLTLSFRAGQALVSHLGIVACLLLLPGGFASAQERRSDDLLETPGMPALIHSERAMLSEGNEPGHVVVMLVVSPSGSVMLVKPLAGPEGLRRSAEEAVRQWKFESAKRGMTVIASIGVGVPDAYSPRLLLPIHQVRPSVAGLAAGVVVMELDIDSTGAVAAGRAVSGPEHLRASAQKAILHWKFPGAALAYPLTISVRVDSQPR